MDRAIRYTTPTLLFRFYLDDRVFWIEFPTKVAEFKNIVFTFMILLRSKKKMSLDSFPINHMWPPTIKSWMLLGLTIRVC